MKTLWNISSNPSLRNIQTVRRPAMPRNPGFPPNSRRFIPHPGALIDADYYARQMVEGHMTRQDVKTDSYLHMYGGTPSGRMQSPPEMQHVGSRWKPLEPTPTFVGMDFGVVEARIAASNT